MTKPDLTTERSHWQTLRSLAPYLWPEGEPGLRARVVISLLLLVVAKGCNVLVPLAYARAVDMLAPTAGAGALLVIPVALVIAYGIMRALSSVFAELRDAVFTKVQARATRQIALQVFQHLHALSLRFLNTASSPGSLVASDDLEIFERCQQGLSQGLNDWIDTSRGLGGDQAQSPSHWRGPGTSELPIRHQLQAWLHWMQNPD
jgi:ABC-type multidrug transport system fused ATPase/permease subunit